MYSQRLLDHFQNPRNVGELPPPAIVVQVENPACGDLMRLSALVVDGALSDIAYKVKGCTASIAAGSALTELLKGQALEHASKLTAGDIESALGGLPPESRHAAALSVDALKALLRKAS